MKQFKLTLKLFIKYDNVRGFEPQTFNHYYIWVKR